MKIQEDQIIGELVAQDYRTASVFKKYDIDFCCQGDRTISDACASEQIDNQSIIADLNDLLLAPSGNTTDYASWPLDLLADYIEKKHHRYVVEKTLEIQPYLTKVCSVHGGYHPELFEIKDHFNATAAALAQHMKKEELILFPYVRKMVQAQHENSKWESAPFGSVKNPIEMMKEEHTTEGDRLRKIETLSNHYTTPAEACNTYMVAIALLKEFEQDLHLHIHLENNILFPKAIALEKELSQNN
ncbi:iron-sulfur cluster repair di-iron protein [Flavobacterium franklandianum]|uniref:Iron-sulfur cluster repair di-iron protein n=1 Tax=Flavobacterium franklandianum TaxID=2594430 RepID=A0A553C6A6_9FLAO|nr:iron-sulfur cluster repair di-iron protein [Flavobacterium franklandianum]TRX15942.1 iron-sulfur cluster repair di-iron protein [Flavobacterium franklandianum]TRX27741.1 iron-sulfur cluster repair di-iron protein [Flavobacterium franklandianum]